MDPRVNRQPEARHHEGSAAPASGLTQGLASKILVTLLILLSLAALGLLATRAVNAATSSTAVKSKQYQALFLTNGQVYFGNLSNVNDQYVKLSNIYYLQIQQQVQPGQQENQNQQPNVSLAKLGGELHGPEDAMYVSRDQVLFWENLKNDGKVAKAIEDFQKSGENK